MKTLLDPYAALALAIIHHAALDLESRNPARASEARGWLQLVGLSWCQILGVPDEELTTWVEKDFALPSGPHRNWRY